MMVGIIFGAVLAVGLACWWLLRQERATQAQAPTRSILSNRDALRHWIRMHMPDLDAEMAPLGRLDVLRKLNQVTGLDVRPEDGIESSCPRFLAALQAQHAARKGAA